MPTLCCDCLRLASQPFSKCPACSGLRAVTHPDLSSLHIAHVDCDAFYASVEKRDDPALRDKPLLVGHDGGRGVVTTACYLARQYGCRSAMPMFKALQLCPDAIVKRPDMAKYKAASLEIRDLFYEITDLHEAVSIDEAYLDLSAEHRLLHGTAAESLGWLAREVERRVGITISIGLSYNKFLAKLASDLDKPRGFSALGPNEAIAFLGSLPVTKIHGVGPATAAKMAGIGWTAVSQLQAVSERELISHFGAFGRRLSQFVKGEDDRRVKPSRLAKSISAETTFASNLRREDDLLIALKGLSEKVSRSLKAKKLAARTVTLKLKTANFEIITRRATSRDATQRSAAIFDTAERLLRRTIDGRAYRLIGVGVSDIRPEAEADPVTLLSKL